MPVHLVLSPKREGLRRFCFNHVGGRDGMKTLVAKTLALAEEMVEVGDDPEGKGGYKSGGGDSQYPGPYYPTGDAPFDC